MSFESRSGGANYAAFYPINSTHTSFSATPAFVAQGCIEQTANNRGDDGTWTTDFTILQDDSTLYTFLETYAPEPTEGSVSEVVLEDGSKLGGVTGSSPELLAVYGGGVYNTSRKGFTAVVKIATSAGSWTQKNGEYSKPTFQTVSQKANTAITVSSALPTALWSATGANVSIAANTRGKVFFHTKA